MASKHVESVRRLAVQFGSHPYWYEELGKLADHTERLEAQLRIAKRALKCLRDTCGRGEDRGYADLALAAMRKAVKKGKTNG